MTSRTRRCGHGPLVGGLIDDPELTRLWSRLSPAATAAPNQRLQQTGAAK
jgi:hypothetical protein